MRLEIRVWGSGRGWGLGKVKWVWLEIRFLRA